MSTRSRWPYDEDDLEYSDATPYIGSGMKSYKRIFHDTESISGIVSFNDENGYEDDFDDGNEESNKTTNSNTCPNCGAYRINHSSHNCDYCGSLVFSSIVHKVNESEPMVESKGLFNRFLKFWRE
jgi:ribosomal protein L32